uniref:Uncharacterized protein n=1 Tax=Grammatophora oceanica TaxID=210454 RepID=A0A7S1Y3U6_9STRA|mmetsp:Transcript_16936/g.25126  ORF Transcript_16936/g.25126 Transcript_16936/m.25126 type:complete len:203 (+) Transcript_16936:3-611(+)
MKILLLDSDGKRIGFLLMINSWKNDEKATTTSTLLGAYIDPSRRKGGLAKVLLGIWMSICMDAGDIHLRTVVMRKPLLCLVLQHTFGFQPEANGGVEVEISRRGGRKDTDHGHDEILLYAPNSKTLQGGLFSARDLSRQGITLIDRPTNPRGKLVKVHCKFSPPPSEHLSETISNKVLKGGFKHRLRNETLRAMLLGQTENR